MVVAVALHGAGLHRFLEDLAKLGPVARTTPALPTFTPEQEQLLELLSHGVTLTAAATELAVSRRTANRLLADVRARLGVRSTAEAVRRWVEVRAG